MLLTFNSADEEDTEDGREKGNICFELKILYLQILVELNLRESECNRSILFLDSVNFSSHFSTALDIRKLSIDLCVLNAGTSSPSPPTPTLFMINLPFPIATYPPLLLLLILFHFYFCQKFINSESETTPSPPCPPCWLCFQSRERFFYSGNSLNKGKTTPGTGTENTIRRLAFTRTTDRTHTVKFPTTNNNKAITFYFSWRRKLRMLFLIVLYQRMQSPPSSVSAANEEQ